MDLGLGIDPSSPHVAFAVESIAAAREELARLGIEHRVLSGAVGAGSEQVFLRDPPATSSNCTRPAPAAARPPPAPASSRATRACGARSCSRTCAASPALSERLSPTDVVPLLNEYFSLLTDIAMEHGGTVLNLAETG